MNSLEQIVKIIDEVSNSEIKLTPRETILLSSLRENSEGKSYQENGWEMVYLDNAPPLGWTVFEFRSILGSLSKKSLYRVVDGWAWGEVKI